MAWNLPVYQNRDFLAGHGKRTQDGYYQYNTNFGGAGLVPSPYRPGAADRPGNGRQLPEDSSKWRVKPRHFDRREAPDGVALQFLQRRKQTRVRCRYGRKGCRLSVISYQAVRRCEGGRCDDRFGSGRRKRQRAEYCPPGDDCSMRGRPVSRSSRSGLRLWMAGNRVSPGVPPTAPGFAFGNSLPWRRFRFRRLRRNA